MAYMNYSEYKRIMAENGYASSAAVMTSITKAMKYQNIIKALKKENNPRLDPFIKHNDEKRVEAVLEALRTAEIEHAQGWRFVEDGEGFILSLQVKYEGNLKLMTDEEKMQLELTTLYDKLSQKQRRELSETNI